MDNNKYPPSDLSNEAIKYRFFQKVNKTDQCWLWLGTINQYGYGMFRKGKDTITTGAHRISYELFIGEIPFGLELDHKCRVRNCVNPKHLEAVTRKENASRIKQKPLRKIDLEIERRQKINRINWKNLEKELLKISI